MTDAAAPLPVPVPRPLTRAQQIAVLNVVRRAARAEILPHFRSLSADQVQTKSRPDDLVTEADMAAEAMITRGLASAFPNALIVGEEAVAANPKLRDRITEAELAFIIDPIDGTWNYAHGLAVFGTIIAATRFGRPVFGLLYDPLLDDAIVADSESDAQDWPGLGLPRRISTSRGGKPDVLNGHMSLPMMPKAVQPELAALQVAFSRVGNLRCSAHEYRLLAQGAIDFVLAGHLAPWDHAAGVLICQRAGGHAAMLDGRDYTTGVTDGYLLAACNKDTWEAVAATLTCLHPDTPPAASDPDAA